MPIILMNQDFPGSNWTVESWGLEWISQHANGESHSEPRNSMTLT